MKEDTPLNGAPWELRGAYLLPVQQAVKVNTVGQLVDQLNRLLELSPSTEVMITRDAPDNENTIQ